jgi:hypothetical protein
LIALDIVRDAYPNVYTPDEPLSLVIQPVFKAFDNETIVSYVQTVVEWKYIFANVVADDKSLFCFVENTCGQNFTIKVNGPNTSYEGPGDLHPRQYDSHAVKTTLYLTDNVDDEVDILANAGACIYTVTLYPTQELRRTFESSKPQVYTAIIGVVFFLMTATFFSYDRYDLFRVELLIVLRRVPVTFSFHIAHTRCLRRHLFSSFVKRRNDIVSSLFPSNIRDRLFRAEDEKDKQWKVPKGGLKSYLRDDGGGDAASGIADNKSITSSKPLADLFPETTIMFADIVGFTAWSSVREPSQVRRRKDTLSLPG